MMMMMMMMMMVVMWLLTAVGVTVREYKSKLK